MFMTFFISVYSYFIIILGKRLYDIYTSKGVDKEIDDDYNEQS